MRSSNPRSRFQPNYRHYHRHRAGLPSSWDLWVGGDIREKDDGAGKVLRRTAVFTALMTVATLVAALLWWGT